jgi:beta-aspartyl-peptidase (threonine type)
MRLVLVVCLAALNFPLFAQSGVGKALQAAREIRTVMDGQVAAWNRHDLEGFMAGYWKSPELTFFSGATRTKGWEPTLERYRQRYQANGAAMGTLEFSDLSVEQLCPEAAFVRGHWQLTMPDGKQPHGLFTLVFRKFPEGWRIVHDHSSAEN